MTTFFAETTPAISASPQRVSCVRGPGIEFPGNKFIHEVIAEQVERTPEAIAVICGDSRLTYREMNGCANGLAMELQRLGAGTDVPVGLCVTRSLEMVIGMLAILKSGAGYLPLDPSYPKERIAFMLADAKPPVVLTQKPVCERLKLGDATANVLCLDASRFTLHASGPINRQSTISNRHSQLAYLIYTSGSTGKPKGVMVTHRNVLNFFAAMDHVPGVGRHLRANRPEPVWLAVTSMCFDISVLELLWTLARGFAVVIRKEDDPPISEQILTHRVTHFQCTPSLAGSLIQERFAGPALQQVDAFLVGGEALPATLARQLRGMLRGELINMYGPTETTVWSAAHRVESLGNAVPIGKPVGNTQIHILDENLEPVANGESGEIFIGGEGVARGYFNRPELNAEKFVFIGGERVYRTGDMGRLRDNGEIEFLGRADQQVKLSGHRIELGEIEAAIRQLEGVRDCAVRLWEFAPDDKRLAAYIVPASFEEGDKPWGDDDALKLNADEIRRTLQAQLPGYMIPSCFTFLEKFPLTPNGKLDRNALPKPSQLRPNLQTEYVAPSNSTEESIAQIWRELLLIESVGTRDNFFDLGGTSLLVAEMQVRLRSSLGVDLPIVRLFEHPTINALAEFIANRRDSSLNAVRERALRQREFISRISRRVVGVAEDNQTAPDDSSSPRSGERTGQHRELNFRSGTKLKTPSILPA